MNKNIFLSTIVFSFSLVSVLLSEEIPVNSLNSTTLNRWIVIKDDKLDHNHVNQIVSDPTKYINDSDEKLSVDLGSQKDIPIQVYQLFKNFSYKEKKMYKNRIAFFLVKK
mgnify:CR=1 FL=1